MRTPKTISLSRHWSEIRFFVIAEFRAAMFRRVQERRPHVFDGLEKMNPKDYKHVLRAMSPYQASVMVRIWTGCAMTAAHGATCDSSRSAACPCGHERQAIAHIVYACCLSPPRPVGLELWSSLPPSSSIAFLCPTPCNSDVRAVWTEMCMYAVSAVSAMPSVAPSFDWKGHLVGFDCSASFAFCRRCLVSRRAKDSRHIASRPCAGEVCGNMCSEGDYIKLHGHILRCELHRWKRDSRRPKLSCVLCEESFWPSSLPLSPCSGAT